MIVPGSVRLVGQNANDFFVIKNPNKLDPRQKKVFRSMPTGAWHSEVWLMSLTIGAGLSFAPLHFDPVDGRRYRAKLWDVPEQVSCFTCSRLHLSNSL
jgi:hypothetical protein